MSTTIDSKVVEMKFDNSKFESNVKETMSTLDKLKLALSNFTGKKTAIDIDTSGAASGINSLGTAADTVSQKFSALEAVAFGALAKIGSQAITAGEQLLKSLTIDQISSGYAKYDEKTSSVQTLVNSTGKSVEEINRYLDQLMWYSDETSYSFTEMTSALAQMTSTGGDIDKLIPTITGIANATAYAGKNGEAFVHTIRNLTQSYNAGYLQLMDWKSLNLAGTSSKQLTEQLIKAAEELGEVKEGILTIENFSENLKHGYITTDVMDLAFGRFSAMSQEAYKLVKAGEFETASEAIEAIADNFDELAQRAFKSAQEAKTFTEAIDATKDAVSSGWMNTFEIIFGNYEQAKELWTDLANGMWDFFAGGAEARNNKLADVLGDSWDQITQRIEDAGISTEEFEKELAKTVDAAGMHSDTILSYYGTMGEWLKKSDGEYNHFIKETLYRMSTNQTELAKATDISTKSLEEFQKVVNGIMSGQFGTGPERVKKLTEAGYDAAEVQKLVNKLYEKGGKTYKNMTLEASDLADMVLTLSDAELESIGYTEEQVKALRELAQEASSTGEPLNDLIEKINKESGRDLLFGAIGDSLATLVDIVNIAKDAFNEIFPEKSVGTLYEILVRLRDITRRMREFVENEKNAKKLTSTFKGLFAVLDIIKTIVSVPLRIGFGLLKAVLEEFGMSTLDLTANIGENIAAFAEWLKEHDKTKEIIEWLTPKLVKLIEKIKDLTKEGGLLNDVFKDTKDWLKRVKDAFAEWFEEFEKAEDKPQFIIDTLAEGFKKGIPYLVEAAGEAIDSFFQAINDYFSGEGEDNLYSTGETAMGTFIEGFKNGSEPLVDALKDLGNKIIEKMKELPWEKIIAVGLALTLLWLLKNLSYFASTLQSMLEPINYVITKLGDVFKQTAGTIKKLGKAIIMDAFGDMVVKFAAAILILAVAIYVISKIPYEQAWSAAGVILTVMGIMLLAIGIIVKMISDMELTLQGAATIMAFKFLIDSITLVMIGLAGVMITLSLIPNPDQATTLFGTIAIALLAFLIVIGIIVGNATAVPTAYTALLSMSAVIGALAIFMAAAGNAMAQIGSLEKDQFDRATAAILLFVGIVALIILTLKSGKWSDFPSEMDKVSLGILAIAGAFAIAAIAMKIIASIDPDGWNQAMNFLVGFGFFVVLLLAMTKNSATINKNIYSFGLMMLGIGGSLVMAAVALKLISKLSLSDIGKGILFMAGMLAFIWAISAIVKKADSDNSITKFGLLMVAIGGSMLLMAVAIKILGGLKGDEIAKGTFFVGLLAGLMTLMIRSFKGFTNEAPKIAASLIAAAFAIGIMAIIVFFLGQLKVETLKKGLVAVSVLAALMAGLIAVTKFATPDLLTTMVGIAIVIATIAAAMAILMLLAEDDPSKLITVAASLVMVLGTLAGVFIALGAMSKLGFDVTDLTKTVGTMLVLLIVITACLAVLAIIPNPEGILGSAQAIGIVLLALSASLVILKYADALDAKMLATVLLMGLAILEIGGILVLLQKMGIEGNIPLAISLGVLLLALSGALLIVAQAGKAGGKALAVGIVAFEAFLGLTGLIIGAFMEWGLSIIRRLTVLLPPFAVSLQLFSVSAKAFAANLSDGKFAAAAKAAKDLAAAIMVITAVDLLDRLTTFGKNDAMASFGEKVKQIGTPLVEFANSLKDLSEDDVNKISVAAEAAKSLTEVVDNMPTNGGWKSKIIGDTDIEKFSSGLVSFGKALVEFAKTTEELDTEQIEVAKGAADLLVQLANALPKNESGTLKGFLFGENDTLSNFGTNLRLFGTSLVDFSKAVSSEGAIDKTAMKNAADGADYVVELANKLPDTMGWFASVFGGTMTMEEFGKELSSLAYGLLLFSTYSKQIEDKSMEVGVSAVQSLADMAVALSGADLNVFSTKKKTLAGLGENLEGLGPALVDFANSVKSLNGVTYLERVMSYLTSLVGVVQQMQGVNYEYIYSFKDALNALKDIDLKGIIDTFNVEEGSVDAIGYTGKKLVDSIVTGIANGDESIKTAVSNLMVTIHMVIHNQYDLFHNDGFNIVLKIASGLKMGRETLILEMKRTLEAVLSAIKTEYHERFYNLGYYYMLAMRDGIREGAGAVYAALDEVATKMLENMNTGLGVESPSTETQETGKYFDLGLVKGIEDNSPKVYTAAEELGNSAINGLQSSIDGIYDVVDWNLHPVITPTLDLSYVKAGTNSINSLFDSKRIDAMANIQNGSNKVNGLDGNTVYQFTQNNYSPKPLSRIELYRQTKNLISAAKG